jgi:voltage-gated potassium channel Kch
MQLGIGLVAVLFIMAVVVFRLRHVVVWMAGFPEGRGVMLAACGTLAAGAVFYRAVEGWGWLDSLYFSTVTLATVGYGDLAPATDVGRLFTILYLFVGLGILAEFIRLASRAPRGRRTRDGAAAEDSERARR